MGAWIEIDRKSQEEKRATVAPLVGAWIEMSVYVYWVALAIVSLPSWERGLKLLCDID